MLKFRLLFLILVLVVTSGYRFRCWIFCSDQTSVQNEYVEQRDRCRDYAQLKLDMAMRNQQVAGDDNSRRTTLVSLFSECMSRNGWNVPGPTDAQGNLLAEPGQASDPGTPPPTVEEEAQTAARAEALHTRAALSRSSECNFARYAASTSATARARAEACDLECAQRLKAAPEAPRPAACPAGTEPSSIMETGRERVE